MNTVLFQPAPDRTVAQATRCLARYLKFNATVAVSRTLTDGTLVMESRGVGLPHWTTDSDLVHSIWTLLGHGLSVTLHAEPTVYRFERRSSKLAFEERPWTGPVRFVIEGDVEDPGDSVLWDLEAPRMFYRRGPRGVFVDGVLVADHVLGEPVRYGYACRAAGATPVYRTLARAVARAIDEGDLTYGQAEELLSDPDCAEGNLDYEFADWMPSEFRARLAARFVAEHGEEAIPAAGDADAIKGVSIVGVASSLIARCIRIARFGGSDDTEALSERVSRSYRGGVSRDLSEAERSALDSLRERFDPITLTAVERFVDPDRLAAPAPGSLWNHGIFVARSALTDLSLASAAVIAARFDLPVEADTYETIMKQTL